MDSGLKIFIKLILGLTKTFFHIRQNSHGCQLSIAIKHKLNYALCQNSTVGNQRMVIDEGNIALQVEKRKLSRPLGLGRTDIKKSKFLKMD